MTTQVELVRSTAIAAVAPSVLSLGRPRGENYGVPAVDESGSDCGQRGVGPPVDAKRGQKPVTHLSTRPPCVETAAPTLATPTFSAMQTLLYRVQIAEKPGPGRRESSE